MTTGGCPIEMSPAVQHGQDVEVSQTSQIMKNLPTNMGMKQHTTPAVVHIAPWAPWPRERFLPNMPQRLKVADYAEIARITKDFSQEHEIGNGLSGVVYEATWKGERVAVKNLFDDPDGLSKIDFLREVTVLSTIAHPNIVGLIGVAMSRTSADRALICELMDGGNLFNRLFAEDIDRPFLGNERLQILTDACTGLACLHSCEMVHCDIKPANILLRRHYFVVVAVHGVIHCMVSFIALFFPGARSLTPP